MKYVAYYRVSTKQQDLSGLGLKAQSNTVLSYIRKNGNELIGEFTETESGKNNHRVKLMAAIKLAKENMATLVIAKLDRLSRNLTFISQLMDSKVKFICCDMPEATELTIHIFAALAQWERKRISERTKDALKAKRMREPEWQPGNPSNLTDYAREKAYASTKNKARIDQNVRHAYHFIKPLRKDGMSFQKIADALNAEGYPTRRGKEFHAWQVFNIYKRFEQEV